MDLLLLGLWLVNASVSERKKFPRRAGTFLRETLYSYSFQIWSLVIKPLLEKADFRFWQEFFPRESRGSQGILSSWQWGTTLTIEAKDDSSEKWHRSQHRRCGRAVLGSPDDRWLWCAPEFCIWPSLLGWMRTEEGHMSSITFHNMIIWKRG